MKSVENPKWIGRTARIGAAALLASCILTASAMADLSWNDPFANLKPMEPSELQAQRGGFSIETPIGIMNFDLGVTVTTKVDTPVKSFELQTVVQFNDQAMIARTQTRKNHVAPVQQAFSAQSQDTSDMQTQTQQSPGVSVEPPRQQSSAATFSPTSASSAPPVPVSNDEVRLDLAEAGTRITHRIAKDHVTLAASVSDSGVTISQSAVLDIAVNSLARIQALQHRLAIAQIGRRIGILSAR